MSRWSIVGLIVLVLLAWGVITLVREAVEQNNNEGGMP